MGSEIIDLYLLTALEGAGGPPESGSGIPGTHLRSGQNSLADFDRLIADLPEQQAGSQVQWSLQGRGTSTGRRFIQVRASAPVTLECQRCLRPFVLPVQVDNRLEVVREPSELEGDEDEEIERIVGSSRFDVLELIEDELILSLPSVPKHDQCPSAPSSTNEPVVEAVRPSPFAVLERLKKN